MTMHGEEKQTGEGYIDQCYESVCSCPIVLPKSRYAFQNQCVEFL